MTSDVLSDQQLLAQCRVDTYRASGPGGQKRNKTESAVRILHEATGISVIATESRSQAENRVRALRRLRKALALRVRQTLTPGEVPAALVAAVGADGRLRMGQRDARYLAVAAAALDLLTAESGNLSASARRLGISTANFAGFLTADGDLLAEANRVRSALSLRPLRPD